MTEAEWLACADPAAMYKFLGGRASHRKWRLFACACCRRHWHWAADTPAAQAVEVAERFADGRATAKKLRAVQKETQDAARQFYDEYRQTQGVAPYIAHMHASACADAAAAGHDTRASSASYAISGANYAAQTYAYEITNTAGGVSDLWQAHKDAEAAAHAGVLRDVVGNPFRPVGFDPAWRTTDVRLLAERIYNDRAFDQLPILADALQDAGCGAERLLEHLRDPALLPWERSDAAGPPPVEHARGCWALDLVLGFA
ncbi:hypothetical protein R5W23_006136 [Gemmata sp. JC673]|uniref:Uncharacterized protein n=1 Tax=Gemmata algarum TaxID=2975278 RepID=A0ABU5EWV5_9BACT|nr:hypothetical protein [Gemmata algarum]MDY3558960.1 hypothetical protein [Gemmata algarum]